jgi:hypothetical protein
VLSKISRMRETIVNWILDMHFFKESPYSGFKVACIQCKDKIYKPDLHCEYCILVYRNVTTFVMLHAILLDLALTISYANMNDNNT